MNHIIAGDPAPTNPSSREQLLKLHDWDELVFGGIYCTHCTSDDPYTWDDPTAWPCPTLREAGMTDAEAVAFIENEREEAATRRQDEDRARRDAEKAEGQRKADEWNARYPVGTPVMAYPGVRPEDEVAVNYRQRIEKGCTFLGETDPTESLRTVTCTPAWTLGHGEPVVSVEGYAGGIVLEHVDPIAKAGESRG